MAAFDTLGFQFENQSAVDHDAGSGFLLAGDFVLITVETTDAVSVTGAPFIRLNNGQIATFDPTSGDAKALNFLYTVQPFDTSDGLQVVGLDLNGGTVNDSSGRTLQGGVFGFLPIKIDAQPPSFTFNQGVTFASPGSVAFSGTVSDNEGVAYVEVFGSVGGAPKSELGFADIDADGNWSFKADFGGPLKISQISAETSDLAGNVVEISGPSKFSTGHDRTFVYTAGAGATVIENFKLKGPRHDVLVFPKSVIPNLQNLAAVIAGTHNLAGGGVEISLGEHDSLTFSNLTKSQLKAEALREIANHRLTDFKLV